MKPFFTPYIPPGTYPPFMGFPGVGDSSENLQIGQIRSVDAPITETVSVKIEEDKETGKKKMRIRLIEAGLSKNRKYYSKEVAESIADFVMERPQLYLNHDFDWFRPPGSRKFEDLVAVAIESYKKDGAAWAVAEMVKNPHTQWIWDVGEQFEGILGASISIYAKLKEATAEDGKLWGDEDYDPEENESHPIMVVEKILFYESTDFVTYPAAGGQVVELLASQQQYGEGAIRELATIVGNFQHQVSKLFNSQEGFQMKDSKGNELTVEALLKEHPEIVNKLKGNWETESQAAGTVSELKTTADKVPDLEAKVQQLEGSLQEAQEERDALKTERDTLQTEGNDLKTKVDAYEVAEAAATKRQKVQELIAQAELDDSYVTDTFVADLMKLETEEEIQDRIKDRKQLVDTASGGITGNGRRSTEQTSVDEGGVHDVDDTKLVAEVKAH